MAPLGLAASPSSPKSRRLLLLLLSATAAALGVTAAAVVYRRRSSRSSRSSRSRNGAGTLQVSIIGDAFTDVVVSGIGELPQWGEDALAARPISLAAGGSALNTAVQLGHLLKLFLADGRHETLPAVVLHTALGPDSFGQFLRDQVRALSNSSSSSSSSSSKGSSEQSLVQVSTVAATAAPIRSPASSATKATDGSSDKTGVCICLSGTHDRAFITHRGVVATFSTRQLDRGLLAQSRVVHVAGFYNCPGLWGDLPALLAECRARGAFTVLSPQHDASGAWAGLEGVLPHLDLFIPNEAEAQAVSGKRGAREAARVFVEKGVRAVVITLGAQGAYALVRDGAGVKELQQPCPVKEVVDTTGAGDAFGAGVLYSLLTQLAAAGPGESLEALDWKAALRWGCAAGAHAVTKVGASAPPTGREEIEANLAGMAHRNK